MRMTWAAARPTCKPTSAITNVQTPKTTGANHGESPSRPRLAPATTLSRLNGTSRPNIAHGWSRSSVAGVMPRANDEVQAVGARARSAPMTSPVSPIDSLQ